MKVEAESNELILRNDKGVVIIIPKNKREEALKHLSRGDYEAIDSIAQDLPLAEDYKAEVRAQGGLGIPPTGLPTSPYSFVLSSNTGGFSEEPKENWLVKKAKQVKQLSQITGSLLFDTDEDIPDYSKDYTTEVDAKKAARSKGFPEFIYKGKKVSTLMGGTPEEQLTKTGITDAQLHTKTKMMRNVGENIYPYDYNNPTERFIEAAVDNKKSKERQGLENQLQEYGDVEVTPEIESLGINRSKQRMDALNLYRGLPQQYNTFGISKYKPSSSKDPNAIYYNINDPEYVNNVLLQNIDYYKDEIDIAQQEIQRLGLNTPEKLRTFQDKVVRATAITQSNEITEEDKQFLKKFDEELKIQFKKIPEYIEEGGIKRQIKGNPINEAQYRLDSARKIQAYNPKGKTYKAAEPGAVMGEHSVSLGKDNRGEYISYYDIWDIAPMKKLEKHGIKKEFGKPYEIYDRVYFKNYAKEGKDYRRMWFNDQELKDINFKDKKLDVELFQEELLNRGYLNKVTGKIDKETTEAYNKWIKDNPTVTKTDKTPIYEDGYKKSVKPI